MCPLSGAVAILRELPADHPAALGSYGRDFAIVQAFVAVVATIVVLINLATDVEYRYLDPRISYS